jgi:arylsulfatase
LPIQQRESETAMRAHPSLILCLLIATAELLGAGLTVTLAAPTPPNVIVVLTDDQGYGELSAHGNPVLKTPCLDRLRAESVRFADFHVAPMCTPTRGQLMTGVDALRNGAMNVSSGRTLLRRGIPTMADVFAASGYRTGQFGKWHLGDSHPFRPQDRGFYESLWFPSSHIGSVPDTWENDYFDDTYIHNGRRRAFEGYTTDVFFREAIGWMKAESAAGRRFFCYLATAAPHWPHFVPDRYRAPVRAAIETAAPSLPPLPPKAREDLVSYLAMIANLDENIGRLDAFLADAGLRRNTILVFLTDNGSTFGPRYFNAGMRGGKVTLWEGGHRVPCFIRWPAGGLRAPADIGGLTQVQDLLPTLTDLCGLKPPAGARFDGLNLSDVLRGAAEPPADRMLVINYSRMPQGVTRPTADNPAVPRREGAAVLWKRWRLLEDRELYNLDSDPMQQTNVLAAHPDIVARMRAHLDAWWAGVKDRANDFEAVSIGHAAENPVVLTACEWADVFIDQQVQVRRGDRKNGFWHVNVAAAGEYAFEVSRWPAGAGLALTDAVPETKVTDGTLPAGPAFPVASARIRVGGVDRAAPAPAGTTSVRFVLALPAGRTTLQTWLLDATGAEICGAYYVRVERLGAAPVRLILDTDMSGDADDAGTLAMLHALADRGECELLATVVNRADLTKASAAAVDAINTWYGRPDLPIGTDKVGPTALQRTSQYAPGLRDGFPNDIGPDDRAPDAIDVYRRVLAGQPDGSVTIASVGALSNLAELWRREPGLVRAKVSRLVVMGGQFPPAAKPETNIATHPDAARFVAANWPTEIVWQGFEIGNGVMTGGRLKQTPAANPVRRAFELRQYGKRPSIEGGQPSYDQAAALYAVRGPDPALWEVVRGGRVRIDEAGLSHWEPDPAGLHAFVRLRTTPSALAEIIETLMVAPPARRSP